MQDELLLSPHERESCRFKFYGLAAGQYEHVILPTDPGQPFPIYLRLVLENRNILRVESEIGWSHQGIEKLLEYLEPEAACVEIRRVNFLCPHHCENAYRLASGMPALNPSILAEEAKQYHLFFVRRILGLLQEQSLLRLSYQNLNQFLKKFKSCQRVQNALMGKGSILKAEALSYGLTGPSLEACEASHCGDAWSRVLIKLAEIENPNPNRAPEGLFQVNILGGRVRVRTPSFFHAAALETILVGSRVNDIPIILASLGMVGTEMDR
ncbi:MAG: hypothetical protein I8H75_02685 [Myxococcaceae bacterium]|nr:hypothetical protein [Myxococcaceae bacterium]MBH2006243.1 hypothetical protein [Myxococcaceae bacterium]